MLDIISYVSKINNQYNSSSQKESNIFSVRRNIERNFRESLDYESGTLINGVKQELLVLRTREDNEKNIEAYPGDTFSLGGIVDCYDYKWLITELDPNKQIKCTGKMELCNYTLNFLDSTNQPTSRPCIAENATKYNSGVKSTGNEVKMTLGTSQYLLKLPYDAETALLDRTYSDGVDRRLLMDIGTSEPTAYVVTQADRITYPGIVALTLTETGRNENDDAQKMIADYDRVSVAPPVGGIRISNNGEPVIQVGKGFKTFTHNAPLTSVWRVITTGAEYDVYVIQEFADNYIKIKILDKRMIGQIIRLDLKTAEGVTLTSLNLEVRGIE